MSPPQTSNIFIRPPNSPSPSPSQITAKRLLKSVYNYLKFLWETECLNLLSLFIKVKVFSW